MASDCALFWNGLFVSLILSDRVEPLEPESLIGIIIQEILNAIAIRLVSPSGICLGCRQWERRVVGGKGFLQPFHHLFGAFGFLEVSVLAVPLRKQSMVLNGFLVVLDEIGWVPFGFAECLVDLGQFLLPPLVGSLTARLLRRFTSQRSRGYRIHFSTVFLEPPFLRQVPIHQFECRH